MKPTIFELEVIVIVRRIFGLVDRHGITRGCPATIAERGADPVRAGEQRNLEVLGLGFLENGIFELSPETPQLRLVEPFVLGGHVGEIEAVLVGAGRLILVSPSRGPPAGRYVRDRTDCLHTVRCRSDIFQDRPARPCGISCSCGRGT